MHPLVRKLALPSIAAIVTLAAAALGLSADRQSCPAAKEFSDSLSSNLARLAGVDSALTGFDLSESARPIATDTTTGTELNRLERRIIALRMEGVTGKQIGRWLREDMHLTPLAAPSAPVGDNPQLRLIHRLETDSTYVSDLHRQLLVTNDLWHDMTVVPGLTARWMARCSAYRTEMRLLVPSWLATMLALGAWGWSRRKSG